MYIYTCTQFKFKREYPHTHLLFTLKAQEIPVVQGFKDSKDVYLMVTGSPPDEMVSAPSVHVQDMYV